MSTHLPATTITHIEREVFIPVKKKVEKSYCNSYPGGKVRHYDLMRKIKNFNKWIAPKHPHYYRYMWNIPERFYKVQNVKIVTMAYKLVMDEAYYRMNSHVKFVAHYDLYTIREAAVSYLLQKGLPFGKELQEMFKDIPTKEKIEEYDQYLEDWAKRLLRESVHHNKGE